MNLLLVSADEIGDDGVVVLRDRRAEHLRKVLKVEPGKTLRVGLVDGGVGQGEVRSVGPEAVTLAVTLPSEPPKTPAAIDLIVGLPRPQALHRVLQTAAAMGVGRLDLVKAWRVEKSFFSTPSLHPETVRRHLLLGAEQGMWTRLPEVGIHRLLVPFVAGPATGDRPLRRLIAHPEAEQTIEEAVAAPASAAPPAGVARTLVAIGPEGGWIDRELETFGAVGFVPVRLGSWILRVENAVTAVLAQLELLSRLAVNPPADAPRARSS